MTRHEEGIVEPEVQREVHAQDEQEKARQVLDVQLFVVEGLIGEVDLFRLLQVLEVNAIVKPEKLDEMSEEQERVCKEVVAWHESADEID